MPMMPTLRFESVIARPPFSAVSESRTIGGLRRPRHPALRARRAGLTRRWRLALAAARARAHNRTVLANGKHADEHDDRPEQSGRPGPPEDDAVRGDRRNAG